MNRRPQHGLFNTGHPRRYLRAIAPVSLRTPRHIPSMKLSLAARCVSPTENPPEPFWMPNTSSG
eukprot:1395549-Amorphochlora_amoeboformis.AAC.1